MSDISADPTEETASASRNLSPKRGPSVWERAERATHPVHASERVWIAACGSLLAAVGLSRRSWGGGVLAAAGGALAVRALLGKDDLSACRRAVQRFREGKQDCIEEASDESFPASDAPSWTATAGARTTTES
jgi:hypothetical protein